MITFQVIFLPLLAVILALDLLGLLRGRGNRLVRLARVGVWIGAMTVVAVPQLSNLVAGWLGVGRGADVVMYLFMLAAPVAWFQIQTKQYVLERKLVELARTEALRMPVFGEATGGQGGES